MKVLVIEDNPRLASKIKQQLCKWYLVETAQSGDQGLRMASTIPFDIVLLDLGLPDTPGLEVCRQIRSLSNDLPIMIVTGVDTVESKVILLENGADDYIAKPFDISELHARIDTLARRRRRSESVSTIALGDLVISPSSRTVTRAGQPIKLRRKEFDILEYLTTNAGRIMSRENIINHAWHSQNSSWVGSVDVHIKQLRDKVDRPFSYPLIKTSYGLGYMIEAPSSANIDREGRQ